MMLQGADEPSHVLKKRTFLSGVGRAASVDFTPATSVRFTCDREPGSSVGFDAPVDVTAFAARLLASSLPQPTAVSVV